MRDIFAEFAAICRKYGLKKDKGSFELFCCFLEVFDYIYFKQYEKSSLSRLETARLIRLLKVGTGIEITSAAGGKVKVNNVNLLADLYMHLNTTLNKEAADIYEHMEISPAKEPIKEGSEHLGIIFYTNEYTEPYTDKELEDIIAFEKEQHEIEETMQGYASNGQKKQVPKIGFYVQKFLIQAPDLFGDFYCYEDAKQLMKTTDQNNLIGDMLELSGVLNCYKGKIWLEESWSIMDRSARSKEVAGWLKSCETAQAKFPNPMVLNGTPDPIKSQSKTALTGIDREVNFIIKHGMGYNEVKEKFASLDF